MVSLPKLSRRADVTKIRTALDDAHLSKVSTEISTRYQVPREQADHFMLCVGMTALDGMGSRTLGKITKRFTSIAKLRSQIGKSLDTILRGQGEGAVVAKDLVELFGQVRRELDGLQADIQTRELGGLVDELQTKLREDLGAVTPHVQKSRPATPQFYEPAGFLKDAYAELENKKPDLHQALEAAQAHPSGEGAALLQKAVTAEDQFQSGYVEDIQNHMRRNGADAKDIENIPKAVAELGRARRKAAIRNPDTLEGRRRNQLVAAIPDRQLAQTIASDDFLLLPAALDELPTLQLFSADPTAPATALIDAWGRYKASANIPDGVELSSQQARGFSNFWRDYLVHEVRPYASERGALWEMSRFDGGRVMKSPKGRARDQGTDFVLAKADNKIRVNDDKALLSSDTVHDVTAFTHELYSDVLDDVAVMEADFARTSATMPAPDPSMAADMLKARLDVVRYKAFGEELRSLTQSWKKGDVFDATKAKQFRELVAKHNVELTVSSNYGIVTKVSERLEMLGITVWQPPKVR